MVASSQAANTLPAMLAGIANSFTMFGGCVMRYVHCITAKCRTRTSSASLFHAPLNENRLLALKIKHVYYNNVQLERLPRLTVTLSPSYS